MPVTLACRETVWHVEIMMFWIRAKRGIHRAEHARNGAGNARLHDQARKADIHMRSKGKINFPKELPALGEINHLKRNSVRV